MILKNKFNLNSIRDSYDDSSLSPPDLINECYERIEKDSKDKIWISLRKRSEAIKIAELLSTSSRKNKPLWGIPFSVKDNIDVEGLATTAACPKLFILSREIFSSSASFGKCWSNLPW